MFQSFTGNSRRPRQVNLSGQNNDPFAATAWTPAATGTQKTIAAAQQERLQRQQERARLNAAKTLQRTWRGHKTRKEMADLWRKEWDNLESSIAQASPPPAILPEELTLLLSFYNPRKQEDIQRLSIFAYRVSQQDALAYLSRNYVKPAWFRLTNVSLNALNGTDNHNWLESILKLLMNLWNAQQNLRSQYLGQYYKTLSRIVSISSFSAPRQTLLLHAIQAPLIFDMEQEGSDRLMHAYCYLGIELLTTPNILQILPASELANIIDTKVLAVALIPKLTSARQVILAPDQRLWLLAQFIALYELQSDREKEPEHLRVLGVLLYPLSHELSHRFNAQHKPDDPDDEDQNRRPPLPKFVADQIATLGEQKSITNLFSKFRTIDLRKKEDAALLAGYAMLLLQVFHDRRLEIRMWLHNSSLFVGNSDVELPAVRFFWQVVRETETFRAITMSTDSALAILNSLSSHGTRNVTAGTASSQEWTIIMLFLELYHFGMIFTDDEEFLAGGNVVDTSQPMSRFGKSALPLEDVKWLTIFLKNLAFTLIYNATEITGSYGTHGNGNLGAYLAAVSQTPSASSNALRSAVIEKAAENKHPTMIASLPYSKCRRLVTGVLRALYERDSRRRFLPQDHWLMTSKFDMGSFIPAVVAEEERRREVDETRDRDDLSEDEEYHPDIESFGIQRPPRAVQMENIRREQDRARRERALAAVGPRLEILQNMPFVIPFSTRVQIFGQFVLLDQTRRRGGYVDPDQWRISVMMNARAPRDMSRDALIGKHHAKIRRENIFDDAMDQFYSLGPGLKEPIQITFVDKFDSAEAGIDGGGVTKEFLTSITQEAFRTNAQGQYRFVTNEQNLLHPNPAALDQRRAMLRDGKIEEGSDLWRKEINHLLQEYEFMGRIVGKCLYEGILIDVSFAGFFLLKWALGGDLTQYRASINDLRDLDEGLYRGLLKLKNYPGNVEDFALDFTINDVISSPEELPRTRTITRNLMPNGSNIPVTKENRISYISAVTKHRLHSQPFYQTQAFLRGLGTIIKPTWLSMFNQNELQTLLSGDSSELDIEDLRQNTEYGGVYVIGDDKQEHPTVQFFWQVMKELDDTERRKVLKYVTSTPRAPLLGFSQLNPRFSIRDAGRDDTRLPSTSTCVNLLKLPMYSQKQVLKEKLLYAVNSGAGFDLS